MHTHYRYRRRETGLRSGLTDTFIGHNARDVIAVLDLGSGFYVE